MSEAQRKCEKSFRPGFKVFFSPGLPWMLLESPGDAPQDGTGEVPEEGNKNRARGKARLSQAEQKKQAFQASGEAYEVGMPAASSLDRHTEWVTGSEQRVRAGDQQRPDPCVEGPDCQPRSLILTMQTVGSH